MTEHDHDVLIAELRALGRAVEPSPDATERIVLAVGRAVPPESPVIMQSGRVGRSGRVGEHLSRWWGSTHRRVAVAVVLAVAALLLTPPVRATVAQWFGFAGVQVHIVPAGPTAPPPTTRTPSPPPTLTGNGDLARAHALISFVPLVPSELGLPQAVEVSADRRVLSMSWSSPSGPIRLDQFADGLDYAFAKTASNAEFISVGPDFALWFAVPHEVVVLNPDGTPRTESARLAGQTLIWEHDRTALRLEGNLSRERAVEIAGSIEPVLSPSPPASSTPAR